MELRITTLAILINLIDNGDIDLMILNQNYPLNKLHFDTFGLKMIVDYVYVRRGCMIIGDRVLETERDQFRLYLLIIIFISPSPNSKIDSMPFPYSQMHYYSFVILLQPSRPCKLRRRALNGSQRLILAKVVIFLLDF